MCPCPISQTKQYNAFVQRMIRSIQSPSGVNYTHCINAQVIYSVTKKSINTVNLTLINMASLGSWSPFKIKQVDDLGDFVKLEGHLII